MAKFANPDLPDGRFQSCTRSKLFGNSREQRADDTAESCNVSVLVIVRILLRTIIGAT